ncbi:MAG: hypothetical protein AAB225_31175 [Acidobacteriota bacterium]
MVVKHKSVLERLASEAIRLGADALEVEYKGGCEEVFAVKNGIGYGIARLASSSPEAVSLRDELRSVARRRQRMAVGGSEYELRGRVYESFGENAFRLEFRRV